MFNLKQKCYLHSKLGPEIFLPFVLCLLTSSCIFLSGCVVKPRIDIKINRPLNAKKLNITLSHVQVINHQIILTGTNLDAVSNFSLKENGNNTNLQIESATSTTLVANTIANVTFAAGKIFDLLLSNANAANTFTINFSLCDSTLGGKGFNCALTPNDKDVLSYDANTGKWAPRAVNGLAYQGTFDASSGAAPSSTNIGDYFIISVAGTIGAINYSVGDWIVLSNVGDWERINNSNLITSVFGRTGVVTANEGDYTLTKMSDVDLITTPPVNNQFLKYNGTNWVPGAVIYTETDPLVMAFAKATLPTCGAGQVLKGDGTSLSCVADNAGGGAFTGTINRAVITDGATGALTVSTVTNAELDYLSGVTSAVQTQLNGKVATDATLTSLAAYNTNGLLVQTAADTFTGRTLTGVANRTTITNGDGVAGNPTVDINTTLFPTPAGGDAGKFLKATAADTSVWTALGLSDVTTALGFTPVNKAGDSFTSGTFAFSGTAALTVQNPVGVLDAANKQYVDSFGQWTVAGSDIYRNTGNVGIGTTAPGSKLEVAGQVKINPPTGDGILRFNTLGGSTAQIISNSAANNYIAGDAIGDLDIYNSWGNINFSAMGWENQLSIRTNGNIGIGTTSPDSALSINRTAADSKAQVTTTISGDAYLGLSTLGQQDWSIAVDRSDSGKFKISAGPDKALTKLTIDNSGNVGIGTTSPTEILEVKSSGVNKTHLLLSGNASDSASIRRAADTGGIEMYGGSDWDQGGTLYLYGNSSATDPGNIEFMMGTASSQIQFYNVAANPVMVLTNSGNVGIGIDNPAYKFQVYIDASNEGHVDATGAWARTSDARYKKNITTLEDSLQKILSLKPVRYDSLSEINDEENKGKRIGFLAQDLEKIYPEVVGTDSNGRKSVAYDGLISPIIKAIQELFQRLMGIETHNTRQDRELASLKASNAAKDKEIAALKTYLCAKDPHAPFCQLKN
jgi:hypothetical protein